MSERSTSTFVYFAATFADPHTLFLREHLELDDQALQKIHEDAIHGEFRKKRRNHGVGINDSDEDTDDDEKGRRIRQGMHKKQKVDRDDIKALGSLC